MFMIIAHSYKHANGGLNFKPFLPTLGTKQIERSSMNYRYIILCLAISTLSTITGSMQPKTPDSYQTPCPYLYKHLLQPSSSYSTLIDTAKYHGAIAVWTALLASISTTAIDCVLEQDKQKQDTEKFAQEGDKFFNTLKQGPLKIKNIGTGCMNKATKPIRTKIQKSIRQKRNIAIFILSYWGFFYLVKYLLFSPQTPYAQRLTNFIAEWPTHRKHCAHEVVEVFDDLYRIYQRYENEWELREDVARAYLLAVQSRFME